MGQNLWGDVRDGLADDIGISAVKTWIEPLDFRGCENGVAYLTAPTSFIGNWVAQHYGERIRHLLRESGTDVTRLDFSVAPKARPADTAPTAPAPVQSEPAARTDVDASTATAADQPGSPLDKRFSFDSFVVGKPNELAHAAAKRVAEGRDLTLLTSLGMVETCKTLVARMGISADVIDLRSLSQRDIDYDLIGASIRKTGRVAVIEQTTRGAAFGAFLVDELQRRFFDFLDQPIKRVTGAWAPPTVSRVLERAALAGEDEIARELMAMLRDSALPIPGQEAV